MSEALGAPSGPCFLDRQAVMARDDHARQSRRSPVQLLLEQLGLEVERLEGENSGLNQEVSRLREQLLAEMLKKKSTESSMKKSGMSGGESASVGLSQAPSQQYAMKTRIISLGESEVPSYGGSARTEEPGQDSEQRRMRREVSCSPRPEFGRQLSGSRSSKDFLAAAHAWQQAGHLPTKTSEPQNQPPAADQRMPSITTYESRSNAGSRYGSNISALPRGLNESRYGTECGTNVSKGTNLEVGADTQGILRFGTNTSSNCGNVSPRRVFVSEGAAQSPMGRPQLRPVWEPDSKKLLTTLQPPEQRNSLHRKSTVKYGDSYRERSICQHLVARPGSTRQICWDLLSIACMFYDLLVVPMQVFDLPVTPGMRVVDTCTVGFWTLDIPNSFLTGFHSEGITEMRPRRIARAYFRGLFPIDFVICAMDWFVLLNTHSEAADAVGFARLSKWTRMLRMLRLLRAMRLMKLASVWFRLADSIAVYFSEKFLMIVNILNCMLFILVACHLIACGWYAFGTWEGIAAPRGDRHPCFFDGGASSGSTTGTLSAVAYGGDMCHIGSWVDALALDYGTEPSLWYRYLTALHWALTQFTPASMEVVPHNSAERIFAMFTVLLGVVTFSSFVSSITGSMAQMRMINMDRHRLIDSVRRFILNHRLSLDTGMRIHNFVRTNDSRVRKRDVDVSVLNRLPDMLRLDLRREMFLPVLIKHPLFWHHQRCIKDTSLSRICDMAMSEKFLGGEADQCFSYGQRANEMYFVSSGGCRYILGPNSDQQQNTTIHDVMEGSMVAEATLWVVWHYRGSLDTNGTCDLMALNLQRYLNAVAGSSVVRYLGIYARAFAAKLLAKEEGGEDLSDLTTDPDKALELAQKAFDGCDLHSETLTAGIRLTRRRAFFQKLTHSHEVSRFDQQRALSSALSSAAIELPSEADGST